MPPYSEGLTEEDVLYVGDIVSTGYYGAEQANIEPGDTIAVIGAGPVGLCAMATARLWGPSKIVAVDTIDERLQEAIDNGVADVGLNPMKDDVVAILKDMTDGRGADATIEAVGIKPTFDLAIEAVRPSGTVSLLGVFEEPQRNCHGKLMDKEHHHNYGSC